MPRSARLWEPGDLLSVVVRAHEGRPIFAGDDDRGFFVDRLRRVFVAADVVLLAWALLVTPPPVVSSVAGIATVHDQRFDRRMRLRLRLRGWRPADLVGPACLRLGATPAALLDGSHRPQECAARAAIAHVACDGAGVPGTDLAELLRVSESAVTRARGRGARVLAEHGWSVDEVLSWPAVPG